MKEQIEAILNKHLFVDSEYERFFNAMGEILELAAEQISVHEPYACNSINRLMDVSRDVSEMDDFISKFGYEHKID